MRRGTFLDVDSKIYYGKLGVPKAQGREKAAGWMIFNDHCPSFLRKKRLYSNTNKTHTHTQ
jgi:hypothetical protein